MTKLNCPNCHKDFDVFTARRDSEGTAINREVLRSVLAFMREMEPGQHSNQVLLQQYNRGARAEGWPKLGQVALSRALRANGATPWRNSVARGFIIPELDPEAKPATPAPSVQAAEEREAFQRTVQSHQTTPGITINPPRGGLAGLPFD